MHYQNNSFPHLPPRLRGLGEIAENLWWGWNPAARMVFKMLNRQAWKESIHNPDKMLKELPRATLEAAAADPNYLRHYDVVLAQFHKYREIRECSLLHGVCDASTPLIAYFSAEYGLHHSLPFYAGGLGFLAGDFLKECSDLRVPIVGIGFMYPEGYVRQRINENGWQENLSQPLDREAAATSKVLNDQGQPLVVQVPFIEPPVYVGVWRIAVGRVELYLLDTDIEQNDPWNRKICAHLYTGDFTQRLRQEVVLGIGGSEVLEVLGLTPAVLHLNEGHAAFAILERIRDEVQTGLSFEEAAARIKSTTIFTTHTPVPAGHDIFPHYLMDEYFHSYWPTLGLDRETFLQLGAHPSKPRDGFNMTAFALRHSGFCNAVSTRHAEITRSMWQCLWPETPEQDVPIAAVTNGIHVPTWIEPKLRLLFNKYLGPDWLDSHDDPVTWELVAEIPDEELWYTHSWHKIKLIDAIRDKARLRLRDDNTGPSIILAGGTMLDHSILTIGFARRFAEYKRPELILYDMERLKKLLNSRWQPIQIIFAGKAHPDDNAGKRILQKVYNAARDPELGGRIAFIEDYGEQFAQYLVHGVDIWLNNPLPPMEACGTSGMKASLNGVPNLSILDGWWIEGHNGKNGWAFEHREADNDRHRQDAEALYGLLEEKIIPLYYQVTNHSVPHPWARLMKEAIRSNAAHFSARRMVKEYTDKFYRQALLNAR